MATKTPIGFPGYYVGIDNQDAETKAEHDTRLGAAAGTTSDIGYMLGTVAPRAGWPGPVVVPPPVVVAKTIGTITITGSATPTNSVAGSYTASASGTATSKTYAWTSTDTAAVFSAVNAATTDVTFSKAGSFDLTVTVTSAGATGSPKSKTKKITAA